ncbi:hypothetical protein MMC07_008489 [Pseudocyphellaria aurata]|nr:hypothetical protein [Pseudocyphellaria aurata]
MAPKKEAATLKRRKGSVSDLGLGPMTTVQEGCLDSPTIPGHHPFFVRSMSVPDCKLRPSSEDTSEKRPRGSELSCAKVTGSAVLEPTTKSADKTIRRRSSMILPKELARLVIPSSQPPERTTPACRDTPSDEQGDKPPQVPPKSPRTKSRASPRPRKLLHSATSSTSTIYSNTSAATSASSLVGRTSPKSKPTPPRVESPFRHNCGLNDINEQESAEYRSSPESSHTSPRGRSPRVQPCDQAKEEQGTLMIPSADLKSVKTSGHENRIDLLEKKNAEHGLGLTNSGYQRETSESFVIHRARPMRRGDTSLMHSLSKPMLRSTFCKGDGVEIPMGFNAREASEKVSKADLQILKKQADERVENFEMLSLKDESDLSKELALLDERCQYLRRTYTSLRQSRTGLHARMVSCLRSPRMAKFSCESVLKQEEALAELDLSIDDWVSKLESAETRRSLIRQKLLEHLAATLTVKITESVQLQRINKVQTLPLSSERDGDNTSNGRHDVQSIKVYADSGVAALLSAIENEIVFMDGLASPS